MATCTCDCCNPDTQPKPEVWIYFGTDILTWSDATKWVELPIPDPRKLSKYLTSDIVDGIQVVENAPGVEDNILYFEYEPIPDTATYGLLKSIDPDNPTIFQIIMSTVVWGHYIEITIDFENNEYQAISNTINGIIGVNNTGTTN